MKNFNKLKAFLLIVAVAVLTMTFTSCDKDKQQDQRTPITVQVKTDGLLVKEMKSFDPSTWVYNYNPNSYTLTFAGSNGTNYTYQKTIAELQAGFSVSILPDTYIITYTSQHTTTAINAPLDEFLDIVISENKNITTPTDLTLQAQNDDFLVVMDNGATQASSWIFNPLNGTNNNTYFYTFDNFKYAYYNIEGNLIIQYQINGEWLEKTIPNCTKGNVYHIVSSVNGGTNINITPMNYNLIGW